jgi:hypothetical protein
MNLTLNYWKNFLLFVLENLIMTLFIGKIFIVEIVLV